VEAEVVQWQCQRQQLEEKAVVEMVVQILVQRVRLEQRTQVVAVEVTLEIYHQQQPTQAEKEL
jgi:hypothetical protein